MIAKTLSGTILEIDVQTIPEFLEQARNLLDIPRRDELRFVEGDMENMENMVIVIPSGHQKELMRRVFHCYRTNIFINSDATLGCAQIFSDAFDYYRKHFNPPAVAVPEDTNDVKFDFFQKMYDFERLLMNLHPYSGVEAPTEEEIMESFREMYTMYEIYESV